MEKQTKAFDKRIYSKTALEKAIAIFNALGAKISMSENGETYNVIFEGGTGNNEFQGDFCNFLILLENRRGAAL